MVNCWYASSSSCVQEIAPLFGDILSSSERIVNFDLFVTSSRVTVSMAVWQWLQNRQFYVTFFIYFATPGNFSHLSLSFVFRFNLLKRNNYFPYHQLQHSEILCSTHDALMCFAWISGQTTTICLYSINLSFFITEAETVYCAVRTGSLNQTGTVSSLKG